MSYVPYPVNVKRCQRCSSYYFSPNSHRCDSTRAPCRECNVIHDDYASQSTGLAPCLTIASFRYRELFKLVQELQRDIVTPNLALNKGANEAWNE